MQADRFYKFVCPECGYSDYTDGEPECIKCDELMGSFTLTGGPSNVSGNQGYIRNEASKKSGFGRREGATC